MGDGKSKLRRIAHMSGGDMAQVRLKCGLCKRVFNPEDEKYSIKLGKVVCEKCQTKTFGN